MAARLKFNMAGFRALRTSAEARADLAERAARIADAAGPGVEVLPEQAPRNRAHLTIAPVTAEAAARVAKDNTLIRALEAGR